eukprot:867263-Pyramimonas_sp.AAC.1
MWSGDAHMMRSVVNRALTYALIVEGEDMRCFGLAARYEEDAMASVGELIGPRRCASVIHAVTY